MSKKIISILISGLSFFLLVATSYAGPVKDDLINTKGYTEAQSVTIKNHEIVLEG